MQACRPVVWMGVCALVAMASTAGAQVGAGQITGLVRDASKAVVSGAAVVATNVETLAERRTVSSPEGVYTLAGLAPGRYRVDVSLTGFRSTRRDGVTIETGETVRLDFELVVGETTGSVEVNADAPMLRTSGNLGQVVSEEKVVGLPLNGRSFITLAQLAPGVALPPGSQLPRINGGRPRTNEYLFDGVSVLQPEPGQVAFFPIIDAIQEFKIETNSPPAEFGRFNGGVVNLTTKTGTNVLRGTAFGFFRNEALNARNVFQTINTDKPEYRRSQFGGVIGGPILRNRTFFFADYQGQRQQIGRTVTSNVPTLLQRQGIFSEAIGTSVPAIYDPATTTPNGSGGFTRTQFQNNTIPIDRIDPVALALLQRYPLPTSSGTANNFRRTANEIDDQDQWDVRIDHRFGSDRDQVFGRLSNFRGRFTPVTPLPDGSGVTSGTLGPQDTVAWAFASAYRRVISPALFNELRVGQTSRTVDRSATELTGPAGALIPGIPTDARFPNTLPTFTIGAGAITQLGSPANTATNFNTSVTEFADSLTWVTGRHSLKMGFDWRWERLNVIQPPSPTGIFGFNNIGSNLPGSTTTGTPLASFLLGQVQTFSIDLQQGEIKERAHFQEYFIQDDWRVTDRLTINPGLRYTLNFPSTEINGQTAVLNLQSQLLDYPGDEPVRQLKKNNFGPRLGIVYRPTAKTVTSVGYGLIWIEMAGITTPFTTPTFPFLQTVTQRALNNITPALVLQNGPSVAPIGTSPTAGYGQGVFSVDADLGSGYVQQWNAAVQRELRANMNVEVAYVGSKITHVGIPDTNLNQLTVEQLALGPTLMETRPESVLRHHSAVVEPRRSDDYARAAPQAVSAVHDRQPVSQQRRQHHLSRGDVQARAAFPRRPVIPRELHAVSSQGRCIVGVRRVDPDGTGRELPGGRQLQPQPRARLLHGRYPERVRGVGRVGAAVGTGAGPSGARVGRRAHQRLDALDDHHAAVGHPVRHHPDHELQRVRWLRHAAAEPRGRSGAAGRRAIHVAVVQHRGVPAGRSIHARQCVAEPGARAVVQERRSGRQPPGADRRWAGPRAEGGGVQPSQHTAVRYPERGARGVELRHDHDRRRSARHPARAQGAVLDHDQTTKVASRRTRRT